MKSKKIDVGYVLSNFRIVDGRIERYHRKKFCWTSVPNTPAKDGYCSISIGGNCVGVEKGSYLYHRVLWVLYHHEDIPEDMQIDHINGIRSDNRIENLRVVSKRENDQNKKVHRDGHLNGTYLVPGYSVYGAQIQIDKKRANLGRYPTEQEAERAYLFACANIDKYYGDAKEFRKFVRARLGYVKDESNVLIRQAKNGNYIPYIYVCRRQITFGTYPTLKIAQAVRDFAVANISRFETKEQYKRLVREHFEKKE